MPFRKRTTSSNLSTTSRWGQARINKTPYRSNGHYVARILKEDKPGDLPIDRSATFELVFNLKTPKILDLEVPAQPLVITDEVIE
jgi:ABC-type uncharacterized transport system substrate-binding protein